MIDHMPVSTDTANAGHATRANPFATRGRAERCSDRSAGTIAAMTICPPTQTATDARCSEIRRVSSAGVSEFTLFLCVEYRPALRAQRLQIVIGHPSWDWRACRPQEVPSRHIRLPPAGL